ncbi:MAG: serine/threonine protein kinase, partial [Tepidisphaeraceae bacterium]
MADTTTGPTDTPVPDQSAIELQQIGPYRLLELLGSGGFGEVYKAERRQPMRHTVAIKVIKLGFDTREIIARFNSERQALARMDHPNVAKVLDAGTTDAGRPYFVMEYVPGEPITQFCDVNKLSIKDRLELFTQACQAINHAHTKAIIHRDIKAGNVLAYLHDNKPTVKVIDFGIAKALTGDKLTEQTFNTERGQIIGTYETMSPEQADGSPDIDTRTDVYSLGVVLYELLSGTKPFDSATLRQAAEQEIKRIIREVEPPRPSTRLSGMGEEATKIATARREDLSALSKRLHNELEWIPLKAIRKERDRRYASPLQLAEDIQNYLEGKPLLAGPESRVYRAKKFLRRNARGVVASAATVLLLFAWIVLYFHGMRSEQQKTLAALAAEQRATQGERAVSGFLGKVISSVGPGGSRGRAVTVVEILDRAVHELDANEIPTITHLNATEVSGASPAQVRRAQAELALRSLPLVEAQIRRWLGLAYQDLGRTQQAEQQLRRAHALFASSLARDDPDVLWALNDLAIAVEDLGRCSEAEPMVREVFERRRRVLGDSDLQTLGAANNLGNL